MAITDDAFGATSTNIDHEMAPRFQRCGLNDALIDEACFFDARDNFNRVTERFARPFEETRLTAGLAQRIRAHDSHRVSSHVSQSLPKSGKRRERTIGRLLREAAVFIQARR